MTTRFAFTGRTRQGAPVSGERRAASAAAAVAHLRREAILVTGIRAVDPAAGADRWRWRRRAPVRSLAVFTRQLGVMIDAGLPLVQGLDLLGAQEAHPRFRAAILAVRAEVEDGATLADAMRRQPYAFDALYTSMVAAGEAGGVLDAMLGRLAVYIEKHAALTGQVRSALTYPAAVLAIAAVVVGVILWKVIPTFAVLFDSLGAVLPLPTRFVIALSDSLVAVLPLVLIGLGGVVLGVRRSYATDRGRRLIDGVLLGAPLVGSIVRRNAVARFCRSLAALIGAGVPILEGLAITAGTAGNAVVADAVLTARDAIERGEPLAAPLRATAVFPPLVTQMIGVGETTGALDTMLAKIADVYEADVDRAVAGLTVVLEPVTVALLGLIVGGIVVAMYLPVFDLIGRLAAGG